MVHNEHTEALGEFKEEMLDDNRKSLGYIAAIEISASKKYNIQQVPHSHRFL